MATMVNGVVFGKRAKPPPDPQQIQDADPGAFKPAAATISWNKLAAAHFWQSGDSDTWEVPNRRPSPVLLFDQPINPGSLGDLERRVDECVEAGLAEVTIVLASPGGDLDCTLRFYERLISLPIKLNTHGIGLVASAATALFLTGSERSANHHATFLFHPVSVRPVSCLFLPESARRNREDAAPAEADKSVQEAVQQELGRLYLARTRISATTIARFSHETLIFDAGTALRLGVIDRISTFPTEVSGQHACQRTPSTTAPG